MTKKLALQIAGVVVPVVVAIAGMLYGDVTPVIRDLCEAALPSDVQVHEVDGGP